MKDKVGVLKRTNTERATEKVSYKILCKGFTPTFYHTSSQTQNWKGEKEQNTSYTYRK